MSRILDYLHGPRRVETLVLTVAAYLIATANQPWWSAIWAGRSIGQPGAWIFTVCCFVMLTALHYVLLAPFCNRWTVKPLLTLVVVASAVAGYFGRTYAVILDPTMLQNVLNTDVREARELITPELVLSVILWSTPAIVFIWMSRLTLKPLLRSVLFRVGTMLGALLVVAIALWPVSRDFISMMRNSREARYLVTPANVVWGLSVNLFGKKAAPSGPRLVLGADAKVAAAAPSGKPRVLVLVIGETARAANFSLFGYERPTNPELAKRDILAFSNVKSCGTSTEVSVPCMFSRQGRADYDEKRIKGTETLLDVLVHAGVAVEWIDNQSGCKRVCSGPGIVYAKIDPKTNPALCEGGECHDQMLVDALEKKLPTIERDTLIVFHMMGNHGPAYYRRYPPEFRRFTPDCETAQLRDCSRDEVVNSYDNAILYTDHVLASLIDTLSRQGDRFSSSLYYVSDHGESLGENDLYLHGLPYVIAPKNQTHVPMVVWLSGTLIADEKLDVACARGLAGNAYSHDNLFDTTLGLFDVSTSIYRKDQDIFERCREGGSGGIGGLSGLGG